MGNHASIVVLKMPECNGISPATMFSTPYSLIFSQSHAPCLCDRIPTRSNVAIPPAIFVLLMSRDAAFLLYGRAVFIDGTLHAGYSF